MRLQWHWLLHDLYTNLTLGSIILMIVSSSVLATARQQPECSSRHQSSAENPPMVAHCPQNSFCFWWSSDDPSRSSGSSLLIPHVIPKITVNSCQSEALPISSDSWYPLLLSCSVVPHMLSLCLQPTQPHISRRCQSSEVLYNCNLSRWVCLSLSSIAATFT